MSTMAPVCVDKNKTVKREHKTSNLMSALKPLTMSQHYRARKQICDGTCQNMSHKRYWAQTSRKKRAHSHLPGQTPFHLQTVGAAFCSLSQMITVSEPVECPRVAGTGEGQQIVMLWGGGEESGPDRVG